MMATSSGRSLTSVTNGWENWVIPSNKLGTTVSQRRAELHVPLFGTSVILWIPLTDQRSEIKQFSLPIF
jgi:hypothetical protein